LYAYLTMTVGSDMAVLYELRAVVQVGGEPAFDGGDIQTFAAGVVGHLVALDLADREVARLRMRKVESADRTAGIHRERFGQKHSSVRLDIEQLPERLLLRVV